MSSAGSVAWVLCLAFAALFLIIAARAQIANAEVADKAAMEVLMWRGTFLLYSAWIAAAGCVEGLMSSRLRRAEAGGVGLLLAFFVYLSLAA